LSHRPFGIIASINAEDTAGLYDRISSGRWELSADQAEYFLSKLDAKRSSPYLDQFRFARELADHFRPSGTSRPHEVQGYSFTDYRVFYREMQDGRFEGFAVDQEWVTRTLRPRLERELGLSNVGGLDLGVYGGAMATVLLLLSGGVVLLLRDLSREARVNRLRADLVSSVSHELKTPITLIRLYGETMLDRTGLSAEDRREFCHIIVRESERLTRLVNQVLTFSRIERGAQVYTLTEGDLGSAITEIVNDYQEYLERRGFTIAQSLGESAPAVRFDETALSQAVLNLLDNAAKYSGSSREIAVRLRTCEGSVIFEVEDHGVGIPAAEQDKIFDRFYRVSNGSGKGGYGLGLFLVRHIMDAHRGRAEVQSEPGRGSCFRLVFPAVN
jgi:signal transduction histidine kinase